MRHRDQEATVRVLGRALRSGARLEIVAESRETFGECEGT
jgi:hypothetical protein